MGLKNLRIRKRGSKKKKVVKRETFGGKGRAVEKEISGITSSWRLGESFRERPRE